MGFTITLAGVSKRYDLDISSYGIFEKRVRNLKLFVGHRDRNILYAVEYTSRVRNILLQEEKYIMCLSNKNTTTVLYAVPVHSYFYYSFYTPVNSKI